MDRWLAAKGLRPTGPGTGGGLKPSVEFLPGRKHLLHVGCGRSFALGQLPGLTPDDWQEIRLDIDPAVEPDVVGSILDMAAVADASVDAVYSSHNIEHLYPHEVPVAFSEFRRVLRPNGFLILTCPDLQTVCRLVAEDRLDETAYQSEAGPIAPIDILYGLRPALAAGNLFMAHRTGFTLKTLVASARQGGFPSVIGLRRESHLELWLLAVPVQTTEASLRDLARRYVPV